MSPETKNKAMDEFYTHEERYNPEVTAELMKHYKAILDLLGEDSEREGLIKTPERVAKAIGVETLRDAEYEDLERVKGEISEEDYKRAKYVIGEKQRVLDVCDALEAGDYETVGKKMYETHFGLSKDYDVSCEELDFLVDVAIDCGVTGSRMMGGGFGGCTINLVKEELYEVFIEEAEKRYKEKYGKSPKVYDVVIGDGSRKIC